MRETMKTTTAAAAFLALLAATPALAADAVADGAMVATCTAAERFTPPGRPIAAACTATLPVGDYLLRHEAAPGHAEVIDPSDAAVVSLEGHRGAGVEFSIPTEGEHRLEVETAARTVTASVLTDCSSAASDTSCTLPLGVPTTGALSSYEDIDTLVTAPLEIGQAYTLTLTPGPDTYTRLVVRTPEDRILARGSTHGTPLELSFRPAAAGPVVVIIDRGATWSLLLR
jgi:hypothetical protein